MKRRHLLTVGLHSTQVDIIITTALIPGKPAPKLILKYMVDAMKPGEFEFELNVAQHCPDAKIGTCSVQHVYGKACNGCFLSYPLRWPALVHCNAALHC